jgi:hypothetical protein
MARRPRVFRATLKDGSRLVRRRLTKRTYLTRIRKPAKEK